MTDDEIDSRLSQLDSKERETIKECARQVREHGYFVADNQVVPVSTANAFVTLINMCHFPTQEG